MPKQYTRTIPIEERFWPKVDKSGGDDACWLWTAGRSGDGYGAIKSDDPLHRQRGAHIVSYEFVHGPVPEGFKVCHTCDNPPCVNPAHLFLGTADDNSKDMVAKGRAAIGKRNARYTKPETTARGERHGRATFTENEIRAIRTAYATGHITINALAAQYHVPKSTMGHIARRETWRHVE